MDLEITNNFTWTDHKNSHTNFSEASYMKRLEAPKPSPIASKGVGFSKSASSGLPCASVSPPLQTT
jgi:hypothetical protein